MNRVGYEHVFVLKVLCDESHQRLEYSGSNLLERIMSTDVICAIKTCPHSLALNTANVEIFLLKRLSIFLFHLAHTYGDKMTLFNCNYKRIRLI